MFQTCAKCFVTKELSSNFYFRNDNQKFRSNCKECIQKSKTLLRDKITKNVDLSQTKTCTVCNENKQLSQFSIKKDSVSGFYSWCLSVLVRKMPKEPK